MSSQPRPRVTQSTSAALPRSAGAAHYRRQFARLLDSLGTAAVVCDPSGVIVHQTPDMASLLVEDPEADLLCDAVREVIEECRAQALERRSGVHSLTAPMRQVVTARTRYSVRGIMHDAGFPGAESLLVAAIERSGPRERTAAELRQRYALTSAELRVAVLLGRGRQNAEIAAALELSPHTVRRHTEKILAKLGVRSRNEVWVLLHE